MKRDSNNDPLKDYCCNITAWTAIATKKNVGMIFYINDIAMKDTGHVEVYAKWLSSQGVRGVKMGFVDVGTMAHMRRVITNLKTFARHKLVVNIHDSFRDHFLQRKNPHLLSTEGVAGDEHKDRDYSQHTLLVPFTRALSGRVDYTFIILPYLLEVLKLTPTFQVAKSIMLTNGLLTIYWYSNSTDVLEAAQDMNNVYSLWNPLDNSAYEDSFYIDADPGNFLSFVRKQKDGSWWIVGVGLSAHVFKWDLSFLDMGVKYDTWVWKEEGTTALTTNIGGELDESVIQGSQQTCSVGLTAEGLHGACIVRLVPRK